MVVLTLMETVEKYYGKQVIDNMIKEEEIKNDEWIQSYQNILHCYICGREGPTSIERPYCDYCYKERSIGLR